MILLAMTLTSVYSLDNVISNVITIVWPSASPGVISGRWERVHLSVQSWDQSWQLPWPSTPPRYRCYSWSKWEKESGKLNVWKWLKWKLVKSESWKFPWGIGAAHNDDELESESIENVKEVEKVWWRWKVKQTRKWKWFRQWKWFRKWKWYMNWCCFCRWRVGKSGI